MPRIRIYDSEGQYREAEIVDVDADFAVGDILYYDGEGFVRLPLGSANQALHVNATGDGIEWRT